MNNIVNDKGLLMSICIYVYIKKVNVNNYINLWNNILINFTRNNVR